MAAGAGGNIIDVENARDALPGQPAGEAHPEAGDAECEIVQSGEFILEYIIKVQPGETVIGGSTAALLPLHFDGRRRIGQHHPAGFDLGEVIQQGIELDACSTGIVLEHDECRP